MFLVHHEILGMIHVVVVGIFNPDPERLTSLSMCTVIPLECAENLEDNSQHSACYWLNRSLDIQQRNLSDTVLDSCTHADVADHLTYISWKNTNKKVNLNILLITTRRVNNISIVDESHGKKDTSDAEYH